VSFQHVESSYFDDRWNVLTRDATPWNGFVG
jgi:hypothetical protein